MSSEPERSLDEVNDNDDVQKNSGAGMEVDIEERGSGVLAPSLASIQQNQNKAKVDSRQKMATDKAESIDPRARSMLSGQVAHPEDEPARKDGKEKNKLYTKESLAADFKDEELAIDKAAAEVESQRFFRDEYMMVRYAMENKSRDGK